METTFVTSAPEVNQPNYTCPRCRSINTSTRNNTSTVDHQRAIKKRRRYHFSKFKLIGTLHYCMDCKMAWTLRSKTPRYMKDTDISDSESYSHHDECVICGQTITASESTLLCSNMCGRQYHIACLGDSIREAIVCPDCSVTQDSSNKYSLTLLDVKETMRFAMVNDDNEDNRFPSFAMSSGDWPQSCEARVDTVKYVSSDSESSMSSNDTPHVISSRRQPQTPSDELPSETSELLRSIRLIWQRVSQDTSLNNNNDDNDSSSSNSTLLDTITAKNLASEGAQFIADLLEKVLRARMSNNSSSNASFGSWKNVLYAARSLGISDDIIKRVCERLEKIYESSLYAFETIDEKFDSVASKEASIGPMRPIPSSPLLKVDVRKWQVAQVLEFLQEIQLDVLAGIFEANAIDGTTLLELTYEDLRDDLECDDEHAILHLLSVIKRIL